MASEVIYLGELRTEAIHLRSQNKITTDAPPDNQGKGAAFSPTDLAATSLASCMATVMGIFASRKNWNIDGTKFSVDKIMAENPRRISEIHITIRFPHENFSNEEKKMLENTALTCPVAKSLHPDIKQIIQFNYSEKQEL